MAIRVTVTGLRELQTALKQMPPTLRVQAQQLVDRKATEAAARTIAAYPVDGEGSLPKGVRLRRKPTTQLGLYTVMLLNIAPLAHIWEFGTVPRYTRKGWPRGVSPSHADRGLLAIARIAQRELFFELLALVRGMGFKVTAA